MHASQRPEIEQAIATLLGISATSMQVSLDQIGDVLADIAVTTDEVDAVLTRLETAGRHIAAPKGGEAGRALQRVLSAARMLTTTLQRKPTVDELSQHTGIEPWLVRAALGFAKTLGKGTPVR